MIRRNHCTPRWFVGAIQRFAFNKSGNRFYVYELAAEGTLAFEAGFETGEFPPAVLLEVKRGWQHELAPSWLPVS